MVIVSRQRTRIGGCRYTFGRSHWIKGCNYTFQAKADGIFPQHKMKKRLKIIATKSLMLFTVGKIPAPQSQKSSHFCLASNDHIKIGILHLFWAVTFEQMKIKSKLGKVGLSLGVRPMQVGGMSSLALASPTFVLKCLCVALFCHGLPLSLYAILLISLL